MPEKSTFRPLHCGALEFLGGAIFFATAVEVGSFLIFSVVTLQSAEIPPLSKILQVTV
jgi:hypothetical protein